MNETLSKIIKHPVTIPSVVGVLSFAGGAGLGYILGRRQKTYGEHEISSPNLDLDVEKEEYEAFVMPYVSPEPVVIDREDFEVIKERGHDFVEQVIEKTESEVEQEIEERSEPVRQSIFAKDDDDWSLEEEVKTRTEEAAYVLHKDEFFADEKGYTQQTLSYYEGDDILCDEDDKPVYNHKNVVGEFKFGHGSGDPNVFYVRNDKLRAEYEILKNTGTYSVEVLGLDIENNERARDVRHSNSPSKFRSD